MLIEIRQAVISAGDAAQPKLSRLAQKRLMLWVVVDAMRSPVLLSGAAADRVGGRIWKQAQRVSDALTATALQHASQRHAARVAAAADPSLEAGLAMKLAVITAAEKKRCNDHRCNDTQIAELQALLAERDADGAVEALHALRYLTFSNFSFYLLRWRFLPGNSCPRTQLDG